MEEPINRPIVQVGVIGAGTMGSALAQKFAQEGLNVILVDKEETFLNRGFETITATLGEGVKRGIFTSEEVADISARINPTTALDRLSGCQLIIEAIFEDLAIKQDLFRRLNSIVSDDTVIATNTSSYSVTELSTSVSNQERFIGLHFFYHAAKNRLVEVIRGKDTSATTYNNVLKFMFRVGKDPIVCKDSHGFVINRFFVPWLNEAVRIVEEELADPATVDLVVRGTFGCGMGPFALMNATGVPIACHAGKTLGKAFGDFYEPTALLISQAETGENWTIQGAGNINSEISQIINERMLGTVFMVCAQLLDEQVCSAGDIERGARIGLRWKRGPVELYRDYGEDQVRKMVASVGQTWSLDPPESLTPDSWTVEYIEIEKKGNSGTITLNRPEDLNALNPAVMDQFEDAFNTCNRDNSIAVVFITGRGKAFMAGADIQYFIDNITRGSVADIVDFTTNGQRVFQSVDESPKKVICVVNGLALGGGLELALTADVILAFTTATFAFPETGIGIYPGLGGTQRPLDRIGTGLTKYLVFTGKMLSAPMAYEIGLVDRVVSWDDLDEVMRHPEDLVKNKVVLPEKWRRIADFFDQYSIDEILNNADFSDEWYPLVKKVRTKAPEALRIAEALIDEQKGPSSELDHIEKVFLSNDALRGLQSVGGSRPKFTGD